MNQLASFLIVNRSTHRYLQYDGVAIGPRAIGTQPVLATLPLVLRVIAEMDQRVVALRGLHDHVAAAAAVAARGSAPGHKFLPPKGHAAVAAVAGFDANSYFIDEHR